MADKNDETNNMATDYLLFAFLFCISFLGRILFKKKLIWYVSVFACVSVSVCKKPNYITFPFHQFSLNFLNEEKLFEFV